MSYSSALGRIFGVGANLGDLMLEYILLYLFSKDLV